MQGKILKLPRFRQKFLLFLFRKSHWKSWHLADLTVLQTPAPPYSRATKDQKIEVSLIHFAVSIHMAVSIIRFILMLHYGSPAVQPWSFVSSPAVLSFPHIPVLNNSCSQTERRQPKINTIADRAAFGHRAWLFDLYCLSFRVLCVCVFVHVFLLCSRAKVSPPCSDCRWTPVFLSLVVLSGCETAIRLIVGDTYCLSS